jgi:putative spermidine/putrescine transport system permease protein
MRARSYESRFAYLTRTIALRGYCGLILVFLVVPILAVVPLSFSSGTMLVYPLPGFSWRWYELVLHSDRWLTAFRNSFAIGIASTTLSVVLGTLASLGLSRTKLPGKDLMTALILSPMIVPSIITAVGMYFFFAPIGLTQNFPGLIIAHTVLSVPFVVVSVMATLEGFDASLIRAAASLGANPVIVFFKVILPIILPGVVTGALFAFATSFDEVITVVFLAGPDQRTLPREMFSGIREQITPEITAIASILVVLATALLISLEFLRRRGERLRGKA